jgi:PAB-dependent poly(A)-specific ribonuclease subunit 2
MASGAGCDQLTNGQLDCIVSEHYCDDYDQYGQQEYVLSQNLLIENADGNGSYEAISSVVFDNQQELLWVGNRTGTVSSYYGRSLHRYSSFMPFHDADEVRCMMPTEQCIFSLSENCLSCSSRSGQLIFQHRSPSLTNMQSMVMSSSNVVCLGGHQSLLVELDVETRDEIRQVEIYENSCAILRLCSSYICCGHTDGMVSLLDPSSLCSVHQVTAHTGALSDFDVNGNQLVTCGYSYGARGLIADRQLMIFDLRYLKSSAPLETAIDPMFLRFIPTYSNRICVVSQSGIFQLLEQGSSSVQSPIYGIPSEGASILSFDRSSSSQFLAFGNSNGGVHVFHAVLEDLAFNHYSVETDFTKNNRYHLGPQSELFYPSSERTIPSQIYIRVDPRGCDPYYAPPTQAEAWLMPQPDYTKPWFNIPAMTNGEMNERMVKKQDADHKQRIQKLYRKVEVKCSKYGVETFDFTYYNKTEFSGLEANVPNAYCNAMLQVLYYLSPLRRTLLNHLCDKEFCLSCELSFLWHMLDQRTFKACQPTNFLRAFRTIDSAQNMELVFGDTEEVPTEFNYAPLVELWNTFILEQIDKELTRKSLCDAKK